MNRRIAVLVGAASLGGAAVFAAGLTQATTNDLTAILVLIALGALAERYSVGLFNSYVSVGATAILVAAIIGGLWGVALVGPAIALAGDIRTPAEWYKRAFNGSVYLLSGAAFWCAFAALDPSTGPDAWPGVLVPAGIGAAANYGVNTGLVALAIAWQTKAPFSSTFKGTFVWLLPQYLIVGLAAVAAATAYEVLGLWAFAVFAAPVAGIRHAYAVGAPARAAGSSDTLPRAA